MSKPRKFVVPPFAEQNEVIWPDPKTATRAELRAAYEKFYDPSARNDLIWASHTTPTSHGEQFNEHRAKIISRGICREKSARSHAGVHVLH